MPIHDWTRVDAGIFHDFHLGWIAEIRHVLNGGLLPPNYYALAERSTTRGVIGCLRQARRDDPFLGIPW